MGWSINDPDGGMKEMNGNKDMTDVSNSTDFINSFNNIEKMLKNKYNIDEYVGFTKLINDVEKKEKIISINLKLLESYASLRNAIVHNQGKDIVVIAEPHIKVVEKIKEIERLILNPPKVLPMFQKNVLSLKISDSIFDAIDSMFKNNYSQMPINEDDRFVGLLNSNTVTRWFGGIEKEKDDNGSVMIMNTEIKDVLNYTEINDNYRFINRKFYIQDISDIFENNKNVEAILITNSGNKNEKFLGIITIWDLVEITKILSN